jgi:hypothetical protein
MSRSFYQVFVTYILQMFSEGTVSAPADISVFSFGPQAVKQAEGNYRHRSSYPLIKLWQHGGQW